MDASILLVGEPLFQTLLSDAIRRLFVTTIEVASNPQEAVPLIQAQQPDLVILQSMQPGSLDLCRQIKSQNRLAWIYCILTDESSGVASDRAEFTIEALEAGADACLKLELEQALPEEPRLNEAQLRLLLAQIGSGLRRVHNHRELLRTNDLLSAIALSDPLTELNNRRALEWELPRQIAQARSRNLPISVLMLDVDFFKSINDNYGHLVGDRALQLLSARLRHNLRFYDTPFRYGGEEFVILLQETDYREATQIARRICLLVSSQPFAISSDLDLSLTISAGTTSLLPEDDSKGLSLLQRADQNLLRAKSSGRNRVVGWSDESDS